MEIIIVCFIILLKFVPKGPFDYTSACSKPLSEPFMTQFIDTYKSPEVNSLWPSDVIWHQNIVFCLLGTKPLPKPVLTCQLDFSDI